MTDGMPAWMGREGCEWGLALLKWATTEERNMGGI